MKPERKYRTIGDIKLSWIELGEGDQPLILLHGGWFWGEGNWSVHFEALSPHFRIYAPDNRGHGHTSMPEGSYENYDKMVGDTIGFVRGLNLECKPVVMGHSEGAILALLSSIKEPELFERQVLISINSESGASEKHRRGMEEFFHTPDFRSPPGKWRYFFKEPWRTFALWMNHRETNWYVLLSEIWNLWIQPLGLEESDYARITCPTQVVYGEQDEHGNPDQFDELSDLINKGKSEMISRPYPVKDAKHMFVTDMPAELMRRALPFLRNGEWPDIQSVSS